MSEHGFALVNNTDPEGFWPSWSKDNPFMKDKGVPHVFVPANEGDKVVAYNLHPTGEPRRGFFYDVHEHDEALAVVDSWNKDTTMKVNGKRFCDENYMLTPLKIGDPA